MVLVTGVLLVLLTVALVFLAASIAAVVASRWFLRRLNRVHRGSSVQPPLLWLVSPATSARLHRQLRSTANLLAAGSISSEPLRDLASNVISEAVRIDAALVTARHLSGTVRRQRLAELSTSVRTVNDAAIRIQALAQGPLVAADTLTELTDRLDHLESAHSELRMISSIPTRPSK